jgi:hypothetical protein
MKLNQLRQLIREEISKAVNENPRLNPRQQGNSTFGLSIIRCKYTQVDNDNEYKGQEYDKDILL